VGTGANMSGTTFTNVTALGYLAIVNSSSKMILGNNSVNVGIGLSNDVVQNGPLNKLEINAGTGVPTGFEQSAAGTAGVSGLRFRDLHSASATASNPGAGVLSVNSTGDVIYVPAPTGTLTSANNGLSLNGATVVLGAPCGAASAAQLLNDREIPMNGNNFIFSGQGTAKYNVGIGTGCTPGAKLEITQSSGNTASTSLKVTNTDVESIGCDVTANGPYAIKGLATLQSSTLLTTTGVYGEAIYNSTKANFGVEGFSSQSSSANYGGRFQAKSAVNTPVFNYGMEAEGLNADNNFGGYFVAGNAFSATAASIGIYATSYGIGGAPGGVAGYFDGDIFVNGPMSGTGTVLAASDSIFKTNVDTIPNAMAIIKQLKPRQYYLDTANTQGFNFSNQKQYGVIAQDVELILPELISYVTKPASYDSDRNLVQAAVTYRAVNYNAFISLLMKGAQEQQSKIDSLTDVLSDVVEKINSCCNTRSSLQNNQATSSSIDVELKDVQSVVLEQNAPNPFAEQTTISYFLPENMIKAQILFYNSQGRLIQSVELNEKGKGQLNVFGKDLSNGIYTYTLVVDGKIIETKKMVKQ
jgi:endosialidase-like protein/type IX secretion system substrate protein